jgi:hypothetical protein
MPFPLPEKAPGTSADEQVAAVAEIFARSKADPRFDAPGHQQLIASVRPALTRHVYSYFDVSPDEEILIEDTVQTLHKSATPSRSSYVPTLAEPTSSDRRRYAETLIDALQAWAGVQWSNLATKCTLSEKSGIGVLTIHIGKGHKGYSEANASSDLDAVLTRIKDLAPDRYGSLVYLRNLAVLEPPARAHLIKPLTMRFWLRSAALNDADAVASRLLSSGAGRAKA